MDTTCSPPPPSLLLSQPNISCPLAFLRACAEMGKLKVRAFTFVHLKWQLSCCCCWVQTQTNEMAQERCSFIVARIGQPRPDCWSCRVADTHISPWRKWRIGTTGPSCLRTGLGTGLRPEVAQSNLSTSDTTAGLLDRYQEKMGFS